MGKLTPKDYPNIITLSTEKIQDEVLKLINYARGETYLDKLNYLLDSYLNLINSSKFQGGHDNFYNVYHAIPVFSNKIKGYCRTLASYFYASTPIYYEHEYLQGHISGDYSNHSKTYKKSVFYSLENILKSKTFNKIINLD